MNPGADVGAIYIDADACPVKDAVYKVAARYGIPVVLVANSRMRVPEGGTVKLVLVAGGQLDSADDWIAARAGARTSWSPRTSRSPPAASPPARASWTRAGGFSRRTPSATRWRPAT